jgi:hypothetical protein
MSAIGGAKGWLVLSAVAALVAMAVVPAVAGTASASPAPNATVDPSNQWAYGGMGYSNGSITFGQATLTWNASFGWTVVFTETNTSNTTFQLEEQRTVGISVGATLTAPETTAHYKYHGQEVDVGFANLTNDSTVYVNGSPVPALGLLNDAVSAKGSIAESISVTHANVTRSASLSVNAQGNFQASFTPALGLIPLNLSGVSAWNSTATVHPSGAWNITWAWDNNGFGNGNGTGTGNASGTFGTTGTVDLSGHVLGFPVPTFADHKFRTAIVLFVQGPLGQYVLYDGFILTPPAFALFGAGVHGYNSEALGSASIASQDLYVSSSPRGPMVTAGETSFGAANTAVAGIGVQGAPSGSSPAVSSAPAANVQGAPMTVPAAQAEASCLTGGCGGASGATGPAGSGLVVLVVALAVVAIVGSVGVIEWRSYARRRARNNNSQLVGGYAEQWPNGVPPAAAGSAPPALSGPEGGPSPPEMPPRQT